MTAYILKDIAYGCGALILIIVAFMAGRVLGPRLLGWLDGIRYSLTPGGHKAPAAKAKKADPVYGDTAEHDAAFAEALREAREEHLVPAAEPCGDPGCSQMTHDGTGQMAALDAEALSLMADLAADGQTRRAENLRLMHAPGTPSYYPYPTDLPGPAVESAETSDSAESRSGRSTVSLFAAGELDRGAASPAREAGPEGSREKGLPDPEETGVAQAARRAGELTRRIRAAWTILTGRRPQNLPVPAALDVGADGEPSLTGQDGDGVLTGEVVQPPAAAPVVVNIVAITVTDPAPDPWLEAKVAAVRAQIDADAAAAQRELRAWSDSLLAITAGASS